MRRVSDVLIFLLVLVVAVIYVEIRMPAEAPPAPEDHDAANREILARLESIEVAMRERPARGPADVPETVPARAVDVPEPEAADAADVPEKPEAASEAERKEAAQKRIREFLAKLSAGTVQPGEIDRLWEILPGSGLTKEAIEAFTEYAKAHPRDPDAHYGLGVAITASFIGEQASTLQIAALSAKADMSFSKALELDDQHFGARFSKALSYTFWPAFLGKGPEAIKHFEILVDRHGTDRSNDTMRQVYLTLGTEYQKAGNAERAKATFRKGLEVFPDAEEMKTALEVMD